MTNFEPNPVQGLMLAMWILAHTIIMALACQAQQFICLTHYLILSPLFKQLAAHQQAFVVLSNGSTSFCPKYWTRLSSTTLKGKTILSEDSQTITLEVMAGEDWYTARKQTRSIRGWYGLEKFGVNPKLERW